MLLVCTHGGRGTRTGFTQEDLEANTQYCPFCRRKLDWSKASLPPEVLARLGLPLGTHGWSLVGGAILGVGGSLVLFLSPPGQDFLNGLRSTLGISARHAGGGGFFDRVKAAFQRPAAPTEDKPFAFGRAGKVSGHVVQASQGGLKPHSHVGDFKFL